MWFRVGNFSGLCGTISNTVLCFIFRICLRILPFVLGDLLLQLSNFSAAALQERYYLATNKRDCCCCLILSFVVVVLLQRLPWDTFDVFGCVI